MSGNRYRRMAYAAALLLLCLLAGTLLLKFQQSRIAKAYPISPQRFFWQVAPDSIGSSLQMIWIEVFSNKAVDGNNVTYTLYPDSKPFLTSPAPLHIQIRMAPDGRIESIIKFAG